MEKQTIREIEQNLSLVKDRNSDFIRFIEKDERKGVQQLLKKWYSQQELEKKAYEKHLEMIQYEHDYRSQGYENIAGIDEVGRGPLAGPVVAAAVILPPTFYLPGLDDSKKLSEQKRNAFFEIIKREALSVSIGIISVKEIDRINILEASKKAMLTAIAGLKTKPDFLLIDAVKLMTPYPQEAIIKGDGKSISIAAASIVAKVTRDRMLIQLAKEFPQYGFSQNMGYGTKEHLNAIKEFGITPHHRKSFAPIKEFIIEVK
ncbi:ribonuclease HII [Bacillus sp. FJAT-49705]|uniref:Ribonuclease HII n=1 Tax=Cytobacillus citreus TaxID=2833586 RepID=A0ABS5NN24_9BACI|nr:ribonuclease HII [Cytobacillus citreus]MBS4189212.1 ribonuclease HII [Cytobacillus citreus]